MYCNDGDWVESCSVLVEDFNGRLSLWNWAEQRERLAPLIERVAQLATPRRSGSWFSERRKYIPVGSGADIPVGHGR